MEMSMNIVMTGSSGLIGSALKPFLATRTHRVACLVRRRPEPGADEILWNPDTSKIDVASLEGFDAVIHLAGDSIATGRWSTEKKQRILDSRVQGTELLARTLAALQRPPRLMISASAVGYYGDRGAAALSEESGPGSGFLAEVCRKWERAASLAAESGMRLAVLRLGMVLSAAGGALPKMLPPFRFGVGGRLGNGRQYIGWIALEDLLEIISVALHDPSLHGPVNTVAPNPVTNLEFTKALGRALKRPTVFAVPAFAIRMIFGEMGEQVLLASARVVPMKLMAAGYRFLFPDLEQAFRHIFAA
jgi:uncharacterized protein (TIGR01777 family)